MSLFSRKAVAPAQPSETRGWKQVKEGFERFASNPAALVSAGVMVVLVVVALGVRLTEQLEGACTLPARSFSWGPTSSAGIS